MKIAIMTPGGVDRSGSGKVIPCLLWLIERLAKAGHEVHVFAAAQEPEPGCWPLLGAIVHNAGRRPRTFRMMASLVREHRDEPFEVVHGFWVSPGVAGAVPARLLRIPFVLTLPGGDVVAHPEINYGARQTIRGRLILRLATLAADVITTPSDFMRQLSAQVGIRAEVVTLGVDVQRWPPLAPRARSEGAPLRLLHVASLNRVKDQTTLLKAMALLRDRGLPFDLQVIGEDTLNGEIQSLARELGLERQVHFQGLLPFEQLRPWFEAADLLVVSSRHEAGQMVSLEAAIAGVPTVGTNVGHVADFAPHAAASVPVGDPALLASAIKDLSQDEPRRVRLAHAAQAIAIARDADYTFNAFNRVYASVVGRHGWTGRQPSPSRRSQATSGAETT